MKSPFGVNKAEDSAGFLLWQTTVIWQRKINALLSQYDLAHAQFVILAILLWLELHDTTPTQIDIVKQSKLDKMTVSKSLKTLTQKGLVARHEHKMDSRAKAVLLTKSGRSLAKKLVPKIEKIDAHYFGALSTAKQKQLRQLLQTLIQ